MKIGQLGILSRGVTYSPPEDLRSESDSTSIWLLRSTNLQGGEINLDDVTIVAAHCAKPNQRLANGDIAICTANGSKALVGKASLVCLPNPSQYVVGAFCARMRPNDGESPEFLAALFESGFYKSWIGRLLAGTNINNLKPSDIASCSIRMPSSLAQRNRLGEIFSLSRLQIKTLDRLIAAKREQKRGLMQQLLTGKLRFPGFTEPWKTVRLGDVADIDSELLPASTSPTFAFHYIDLSSVNHGDISAPDKSIDFATAPSRARRVLRRGDVLLSTVRPLLLGFGLLDLAGGPYIGSTGFAVIRTEAEGDARFIFEWLFSSAALRQMHARTTGSSYPALGSADIYGLYLPWPPSSEREKIGALFGAMTKELNLLAQQRAAFAAQRRGLMEKLLSGEIDIQNPKETAA